MYDTNSSLIGYEPLRSGWRDVLVQHGAVPDASTITLAYDFWCRIYNLNPNLLLAQACHEATYLTSERWQEEWNPAGLGVTSDNTAPNPFPSPSIGIEAHTEHMCCYVYTNTTCPCDHTKDAAGVYTHMVDRRHVFHDGHPAIKDLERLPDRGWANPGTGYVDSILSIANGISGGATPMSMVPTAADLGYPGTVQYATGSGEYMSLADVRWFVAHDTEGGFAGAQSTLSGQISAHLLIDKDGTWCFMVPLNTVAYAAGNLPVNRASVNVEHVGYADAHDGGYTDPQYRCCAAFYRFCVKNGMVHVPATYIGRRNVNGAATPDIAGILGHMDVPRDDGAPGFGGNYGHTDPGPTYDFGKLIAYIGGSAVADIRAFAETQHDIRGNIKGYWERFGTDEKGINTSIELFGFPVSAVLTDGYPFPTQYFERQVLEDHSAEGKGVMGQRLGAEKAKRAGLHGLGID